MNFCCATGTCPTCVERKRQAEADREPIETLAGVYLAQIRAGRAIGWEHRRELRPDERAVLDLLVRAGSQLARAFLLTEESETLLRRQKPSADPTASPLSPRDDKDKPK